jgi:DNA-binding HxlR family transcriptional regulator
VERECCDGVYQCPCPPVGLIDVVGKKWAMCVVSLLGWNGELRFGPIQRSLPRVSPATLTATLRALEGERLIRRTSSGSVRGSPVSYGLTTRGAELYRNLLPLAGWLRDPAPECRPAGRAATPSRPHGRTA